MGDLRHTLDNALKEYRGLVDKHAELLRIQEPKCNVSWPMSSQTISAGPCMSETPRTKVQESCRRSSKVTRLSVTSEVKLPEKLVKKLDQKAIELQHVDAHVPMQLMDSSAWRRKLKDVVAADNAESIHRSQQSRVARHSNFFGIDKELPKHELAEEEYNVNNLYWETGIAQAIVRSDHFARFSLVAIVLNAIYIGLDLDAQHESGEATPVAFKVAEQVFCVIFTMEIAFRFAAFRTKMDCCKDGWFRFDSTLVLVMIFEAWIMPVVDLVFANLPFLLSITKLLRLLRLSRMLRLSQFLPELATMLHGMRMAGRAVLSSAVLLIIMVYVFGAIMHTILSKELNFEQNFSSLPRCMMTLALDGSFLDSPGLLMWEMVHLEYYGAVFLFSLFIFLSALLIMNMLIGILCEVVSATAQQEKDKMAISKIKKSLLSLFKDFDRDDSGSISWQELLCVIEDPSAMEALTEIKVDVPYLLSYAEMLFEEADEILITEIMDLVLKSRIDLPVMTGDLLRNQDFADWQLKRAIEHIERTTGPC